MSGHASTTVNKTSITSDTSGTTVTLTTTDNAGNTCTTTKTIKIDKTAPTLTVSAYKCSNPKKSETCVNSYGSQAEQTMSTAGSMDTIGWTNNGGYFAYSASDTNFENVIWRYNDSGSATDTELTHESEKSNSSYVTLTGEGYRVGTITAYDQAGNSTRITVRIKIDKTKPTLTGISYTTLNFQQWDSNNQLISGNYIKTKPTCSSTSCTTGTVCLVNKQGSFLITYESSQRPENTSYPASFRDNMSGIASYQKGREIYDKDGNLVESCQKTKGHNPCTWKNYYYAIDKAGNESEKVYIQNIVGYIGQNDGSGC